MGIAQDGMAVVIVESIIQTRDMDQDEQGQKQQGGASSRHIIIELDKPAFPGGGRAFVQFGCEENSVHILHQFGQPRLAAGGHILVNGAAFCGLIDSRESPAQGFLSRALVGGLMYCFDGRAHFGTGSAIAQLGFVVGNKALF